MLNRFQASAEQCQPPQRFIYRDYMVELIMVELINGDGGWQVGIHSMRAELPKLECPQFAVEAGSKDEALSVGCRRIDRLLAA